MKIIKKVFRKALLIASVTAILASTFSVGNLNSFATSETMEHLCDFENYTLTPGCGGLSQTGLKKVSGCGIDGSNALKYEPTSALYNWTSYRLTSLQNLDGICLLEKDEIYRITINYYVTATPNTTAYVNMWSNKRNDVAAVEGLKLTLSDELVIDASTPINQWRTFTATFYSEFYNNDTTYDEIIMGIKCADKATSGFAVYFDNITVRQIPESEKSTITMYANDGTGAKTVYSGIRNSEFSPEAPSRKGYYFDGWYTDEKCTDPIHDIKFPSEGNLNIYPKYEEIDDSMQMYDFENYTLTPGCGGLSSTGLKKESGCGINGSNGLKYEPTANLSNWTSSRLTSLQNASGICLLEKGEFYRITINYYVIEAPSTTVYVNMWSNKRNDVSAVEGLKLSLSEELVITDTTATGQWNTFTAIFSPEFYQDNTAYDELIMGIKCADKEVSGFAICFDNIIVQKIPDSEKTSITQHSNDGTGNKTIFCGIKDTVFTPTPETRKGYYFDGWYADEKCTKPIYDIKFPSEGNLDIYPKYQEIDESMTMFDFENYKFSPGSSGMSSTGLNRVSGCGINKSYALKYEPTASLSTWTSTRVASLQNAEGTYLLKEGAIYRVTINYYVTASPETVASVSMWSNKRNNVMAAEGIKLDLSEELNIDSSTPIGQWLTYTASFSAKFYDNNPIFNELLIGVKCANGEASGFAIYFDNIIVQEVPDSELSTITLHLNDGTATATVVRGLKGTLSKSLTVERKGYLFDGWFADEELKKPLSDIKFPESGNLDIYAKWRTFDIGDTIHVSFADYCFTSGSPQMNAKFTVDHSESVDGDSASMRANWLPGEEGNFMLNYKDSPLILENGARYLVTFSYKNSAQQPTTWAANLYTTNPNNVNSGIVQQSTTDINLRCRKNVSTSYGNWQRFTYDITINAKKATNTALAVNMIMSSDVIFQGYDENNRFKLYFDDFTITRINNDDAVAITHALDGPDYFLGKPGETIILPNDLTSEEFAFMGWYRDESLSEKIDSITLTSSDHIYGNWVKMKFAQDFENYNYSGYGIGYDMDYEIYNESVSGYDANYVYSGKNSLHRVGNIAYPKRFTLSDNVNDKFQIGETYKITYYVRMGNKKTTDGYIQFVPTNEYNYPAASDGDFFVDSVSLASISDGNWYKVTKVITLYNQYLAMRTPQSSDLYFDNISIELISSSDMAGKPDEVVCLGRISHAGSEDYSTIPHTGEIPQTGERCNQTACMYSVMLSAFTLILMSKILRRSAKGYKENNYEKANN